MNASLTQKILLILIGVTNAQHLTGLCSKTPVQRALPSQRSNNFAKDTLGLKLTKIYYIYTLKMSA